MLSPKERCRVVRDIGRALQNSPRSGCCEMKVGADGNSRNRVKMCQHQRCILQRMKKSGTAGTDF